MYTFLLVIYIITSLILVAVILLQAGKGGGLADTFGGGASHTTIFGQKTSVFLTRLTMVSAILFLTISLLLAVVSSKRAKSLMTNTQISTQTPAATKTVKKVQVDPQTGEEKIIEQTTVPATKQEADDLAAKLELPKTDTEQTQSPE